MIIQSEKESLSQREMELVDGLGGHGKYRLALDSWSLNRLQRSWSGRLLQNLTYYVHWKGFVMLSGKEKASRML